MNNPALEGICLIDKEAGCTSFHLITLLRKKTGIRTIGHAGTLDPFATGLMICLIGKPYTKQSDRFLNSTKRYLATLQLGSATDTYDLDGTTTHTSSSIPTLPQIESALQNFQGIIEQIPPMFSAKKVQGKKLYELARKGKTIERAPIKCQLLTTLIDYSYPTLTLDITCSKGTYIRSIAHDLGNHLGCFAHLSCLKRLAAGPFELTQAIPQKYLMDPTFRLETALLKELPKDFS